MQGRDVVGGPLMNFHFLRTDSSWFHLEYKASLHSSVTSALYLPQAIHSAPWKLCSTNVREKKKNNGEMFYIFEV